VAKVAKSGLIRALALERILELEREVSRHRHHVSVLSKRSHQQGLRIGELIEEGGIGSQEEVAVVEVAKQVESGVTESVMISHIGAVRDENVVVLSVAGGMVAVSVEEAEVGEESEVALVRLPGGVKKRRLDEKSGSLEVVKDLAVVKA